MIENTQDTGPAWHEFKSQSTATITADHVRHRVLGISSFIGCSTFIALLLLGGLAKADLIVTFENGFNLDGDGSGDTASFTDASTGVTGVLTTHEVTDFAGDSGAVLNANADSLGVAGGEENSMFDGKESWTFSWNISSSFLGINFNSFTGSDSFSIGSNDWIGLVGVVPRGSSSYNASTGVFTLTDSVRNDNFTLADITGGAALDLAAGSNIKIAFAASTGASTIQNITFATAVPEPNFLILFAVSAAVLLIRRRKYGFLQDPSGSIRLTRRSPEEP